MKPKFILCLALATSLSSILLAQTNSQSSATVPINSTKFTLTQPWQDGQIVLVLAGSSGSAGSPPVKSRVEHITAKFASYRPTDFAKFRREPAEYYLTVIYNPLSKKFCFIEGGRDVYLADKSGLIGSTSPAGRYMTCIRSYMEIPGPANGLKTAIAEFEKQFDSQKIYDWDDSNFSIPLVSAAPDGFFRGPNSSVEASAPPRLGSMDLVDGILEVHIQGMNLKQPGIFWVDLKAERVIKSIVNGQEMDLNTGNPYPTPLKK